MILVSQETIKKLASGMCASVPQYEHCGCANPEGLQPSHASGAHFRTSGHGDKDAGKKSGLHHAPDRLLDCYTLIFPLHVAGRSLFVSVNMRRWVITKLNHLAGHLHIRSAPVVGQILERGTDIDLWEIFPCRGVMHSLHKG